MKTLIEKIAVIQQNLKAPKNQVNKFGGYNYRSCEDILEAVKPLLNGLVLTVSDEIVAVADRVYVKATAKITDGVNTLENSAFAREAISKKGMDESQITGAASSYARKYALNGLLCIDDTKDADATNDHSDNRTPAEKAKATREENAKNVEYLREQADKCIDYLNKARFPLKAEDMQRVELLLKQLQGNKLIDKAEIIAGILMDKDTIGV
jgi:hypothetical protein